MTTQNEDVERLIEILEMPAMMEAEYARSILESASPPSDDELATMLRAHWHESITEQKEIRFRDSFDSALKVYQYVDLAIACGYIKLGGETTDIIKNGLEPLVSRPAAREYLGFYDYDDVARLGHYIGFLPSSETIDALPKHFDCPMRFAAYFDVMLTHDEVGAVDAILDRMDDYLIKDIETHEDQWNFLEIGAYRKHSYAALKDPMEKRTIGLVNFVMDYGDFFKPLNKIERRVFVMPIRYWLCKLFGYDRNDDGRWEQDDDQNWADKGVVGEWVFSKYFQGEVTPERYLDSLSVLKQVLLDSISTRKNSGFLSDSAT